MNDFAAVLSKLDVLLERVEAAHPRFLTVTDAAAYAGLCTTSIRRLITAGKLTALRPVRGRVVVDRREIDAFILGSTAHPRVGRGLRRRLEGGAGQASRV